MVSHSIAKLLKERVEAPLQEHVVVVSLVDPPRAMRDSVEVAYGMVWCGVVWYSAAWCSAAQRGVMW